jgi:2-haloalkanoic acid dehalogenase type II
MVLEGVQAIAFDCFGTLAEVHDTHFIDVMGTVALQHTLDLPGKDLYDRWLAMGKEVWSEWGRDHERPTAGPEPRFGTYLELWTEQFSRTFRALERKGDPAAAYQLMVEQLRDAKPYPEVHEVLEALRGRYRLCLLSNADDDWLYPFVERTGLPFELVISSESARSYKPRGQIFLGAAEAMRVPPAELLYVGDSPFADVLGAKHAGLPVAWVNRYGATYPDNLPRPDLEIADLRGLLDALPVG